MAAPASEWGSSKPRGQKAMASSEQLYVQVSEAKHTPLSVVLLLHLLLQQMVQSQSLFRNIQHVRAANCMPLAPLKASGNNQVATASIKADALLPSPPFTLHSQQLPCIHKLAVRAKLRQGCLRCHLYSPATGAPAFPGGLQCWPS